MLNFRINWLIAIAFLLASCGGGGGSGTPASQNTTGLSDGSKVFISGKSSESTSLVTSYVSTDVLTGTLTESRIITGASTLLNDARGMAIDLYNDRLYVSNFSGNSIVVFNAVSTANGNIAPTREITGSNTGLNNPGSIFLDVTNNRLYVSNFSSTARNILVFDNASTINGNVSPSRIISGFALYAYSQLSGISVDTTKDLLYVVDFNGNAIYVIGNASTATGSLAASRIIQGNQTAISGAHGVMVDSASDQIIVSNYSAGSILVFDNASSASGNVIPTRTITTTEATFNPVSTVLDTTNNKLYVLNSTVSRLEVINSASTANGTVTPAAIADLSGVYAPMGFVVDTR